MRYVKLLICLFVVLFGCASEKEENSLDALKSNNQSLQANNEALSPAEASMTCISPKDGIGLNCFKGKYYLGLLYHNHEIVGASCYKGAMPHANIAIKKLKKAKMTLKGNVKKSVLNIHLGIQKGYEGGACFLLWITSGYAKSKTNPGGQLFCNYSCSPITEEVKVKVLEGWKIFNTAMAIQGVAAALVIFGPEIVVLIPKVIEYQLSFTGAFPAGAPDDDFDELDDEPDDELDQPVGPNGCECNLPENDQNICFDDTFGKPNPSEYKPKLTVVGRDENFLYIFGKDAQIFNRIQFWSDPNTESLVNCESTGVWDGTFMVHKLQPCRTWFAMTNESKTIWLSPDSQTTRVAEGVAVMPYGQGYNFVLTCGAEPNSLNLLTEADFIKSEENQNLPSQNTGCTCNFPENDQNICFDDIMPDKPLPSNLKPEITVIGRRGNYLNIWGKNAQIYNFIEFWADPNSEGLTNCQTNGEWNGFSMVFKLQPCRTWFAISDNSKTKWFVPDDPNTRVEEGVAIMPYGKGYNFVLTCDAEANNLNLLSESDFLKNEENQEPPAQEEPPTQEKPQTLPEPICPLDAAYGNGSLCLDDTILGKPLPSNLKPEITLVARRKNTIHISGAKADFYKACIFWANPNPSGIPVKWISGQFNGFSTVFEIPQCYNRFTCAEKIEGTQFLSPNAPTTKVEDGVQIVFDDNYNFAFTCGKPTNNLNKFSSEDLKQEPEDKCQSPDHFVVSRLNNEVKLEGKEAKTLKAANFWAWPNDNAPYDLVSWSYGIYDGCIIWYPIPEKQNSQNHWRFVLFQDDKFTFPVGPWYTGLEVGEGVQAIKQEPTQDLVFEIED